MTRQEILTRLHALDRELSQTGLAVRHALSQVQALIVRLESRG
jgi:hypothetical protein